MKPEDKAISAVIKAVDRGLTPPASAIENIIKNQQKILDPFRLGALGAFKHSGLMDVSKFFNPMPASGMSRALENVSKLAKRHQNTLGAIRLSESTKSALVMASLKSSSLASAINVGKTLGGQVNQLLSKGVFDFIEKMRPPTLPVENLKLFNQEYLIVTKGAFNPFIETNQKFFQALDLPVLKKHSEFDSFFDKIKSFDGGIEEELTDVLEEVANYDSDTDDYLHLLESLNGQVAALQAKVDAMVSIPLEEKKMIPSVLVLVLNFAKAHGISLLSIALALYLSYGTDHNVDVRIQDVKDELSNSAAQIDGKQDSVIQAIEAANIQYSVFREQFDSTLESLEENFVKMEEGIQQILSKTDSL